jgi:pimeloyl-ACP methyl ester carboxylesterase
MVSEKELTAPIRFRLSDGRTLAYTEFGDPNGKPIIYCHGWPSTRTDCRPNHDSAKNVGARIIAVDRPGVGHSTFQKARTLLRWPLDIEELADHLQINRFAVAAYSEGGPYGAACAYQLSHRITRLGLIAAMGPLNEPGSTKGIASGPVKVSYWLAQHAKWLLRPYVHMTGRIPYNTNKLIRVMASTLPVEDRPLLHQAGFKSIIDAGRECFRRGSRGPTKDVAIISAPWNFQVQDINVATHIWQGTADTNVPAHMARYYANEIPNNEIHFYEGEGHLIFYRHADEILQTLISTG